MADKKFNQLPALVTPALTDIYAGSANGAGSFKETREQMQENMQDSILPPFSSFGMGLGLAPGPIIGISPGACKDYSGAYNLFLASSAAINPSTVGANGRDSATPLAADTEYYIYVIGGSTVVSAGILSASPLTPIYPSAGYTHRRRRGRITTDGSGVPLLLLTDEVNSLPMHDPAFTGSLAGPNAAFVDLAVSGTVTVPDDSIPQSKIIDLTTDLASLLADIATKADDSAVVHKTGNETVAGNKTFSGDNTLDGSTTIRQIYNPLVQYLTPGDAITANGGLLTAAQLGQMVLYFNPSADCTWQFPTGSDLNTFLANPTVSGTGSYSAGLKRITLINGSTKVIKFTVNTGLTFAGLARGTVLVLQPYDELVIDLPKLDNTPTFAVFGVSRNGELATVTITSSTTLSYLHWGKRLIINSASAITLTFPQQSTEATNAGVFFQAVNIGAGDVTWAAQGGEGLTGNTLLATNAVARISRDTTTSWSVSGGTSVLIGTVTLPVETVGDNAYSIAKMPMPGTIINMHSISRSGTCTATFSINAVAITATANSVSTTSQTQSPTANNTFIAGDYLNVAVTSNSSCLGMNLNVDFTYRNNV